MYVSKTSYILTGAISLEKSEWKNVVGKLRNLTNWFFAKKTSNRAEETLTGRSEKKL